MKELNVNRNFYLRPRDISLDTDHHTSLMNETICVSESSDVDSCLA